MDQGRGARIRRAARSDAADVAEVFLRSRHNAVPDIPPLVHSDDEVRGWVADVVFNECEMWVAESVAGGVVAMMALDSGGIAHLYVAPSFTGQGLGTALVGRAKERRPAGLELWTFASNERARRFYEHHGFVAVERTDGSGNEERAPDIRFVWRPAESGGRPRSSQRELVGPGTGPRPRQR